VRLLNLFINLSITLLIGRYQPPWDENWELDDKFFKQMEEWEKKHPESTFAKVIANVNSAVTMSQPFLGCIPDSPFPARSLVQGLACLLQLGMVRTILILAVGLHHLTNLYADDHKCKEGCLRFYDAGVNLVLYR
jgi:hypothetical protein